MYCNLMCPTYACEPWFRSRRVDWSRSVFRVKWLSYYIPITKSILRIWQHIVRKVLRSTSFKALSSIVDMRDNSQCALVVYSSLFSWCQSTFSDIGKLILFRQFSSMEGFRAVTTPLVSFSGRTFLPALAYYRIYVSLPRSFTQPCLFLDTNSLFDRGV